MKKIATIQEKEVFPDRENVDVVFEDRNTGKAIVLDADGKIGLVGNKENDFLQLPGGGIDTNEDIEKGVIRECLEEIGCNVEILKEVGIIDDFRPRDKKHCINYCYVVKVLAEKGNSAHTENEASIGMYTAWLTPAETLSRFKQQVVDLENGKVTFYNTGFNILRDFKFLDEALENNLLNE